MMRFLLKTNVSVLLAFLVIIPAVVSGMNREEVFDINDVYEEVSNIYEEALDLNGDGLELYGEDLNLHVEDEGDLLDPEGMNREEVFDINDVYEEVSNIYEEALDLNGDGLELHGEDLNLHVEDERDLLDTEGMDREEVFDMNDVHEEVLNIYEEALDLNGDDLHGEDINLHGEDLNLHVEDEGDLLDPEGVDREDVVDMHDVHEEVLSIHEEALDLHGDAMDLDLHLEHEEGLTLQGEDLVDPKGRRRLRCQKIDSLGSEEYSTSYAVKDGSILALRLVPGYDRYITHNINFYLWDQSQIKSPHAYVSRIGLFNAWPWSLISYHRESEVSQDVEMTSPPPMGRWMLMHVNIKNGQTEVTLTAREGESYTVTTPVPDRDLYLTAGRYNVLTPAFQVAWGCQVIEYSHTEL